MAAKDRYLFAEHARRWLLRQPVQPPTGVDRAANDAQLVIEAFEIIVELTDAVTRLRKERDDYQQIAHEYEAIIERRH